MASKKLTSREKRQYAAFKREMQEKGILPQDKPKLNRKKFIEEAKAEWNSREGNLMWDRYLVEAMAYMLGRTENGGRVSKEAIGVAKAMKIAIKLCEFYGNLEEKGENTYKVVDQYNYIKDILNA